MHVLQLTLTKIIHGWEREREREREREDAGWLEIKNVWITCTLFYYIDAQNDSGKIPEQSI